LLDWVKLFVRNSFDGDDLATRHQSDRHETTVDSAITTFATRINIDNRHRARAAIAFSTAFL
jgi:hypothetical protein